MLFREADTGEGPDVPAGARRARLRRAHLGENISLNDLAAAVALSRFHFARMFRQSVGTSPHEYVLQQRLERARTMLSRTNASLLEIAGCCGFADQSHMNRVFRKRVGQTPGQYRTSADR